MELPVQYSVISQGATEGRHTVLGGRGVVGLAGHVGLIPSHTAAA